LQDVVRAIQMLVVQGLGCCVVEGWQVVWGCWAGLGCCWVVMGVTGLGWCQWAGLAKQQVTLVVQGLGCCYCLGEMPVVLGWGCFLEGREKALGWTQVVGCCWAAVGCRLVVQ
jgi:hypothetical protein